MNIENFNKNIKKYIINKNHQDTEQLIFKLPNIKNNQIIRNKPFININKKETNMNNQFEIGDNKDIKLTVALPIWNSKRICWLAIEGLKNQIKPDFNWELIICEEKHKEQIGSQYFLNEFKNLQKVNCNHIKYIELKDKILLAQKWRVIVDNSNKDSLVFILQAADCYSNKERLKVSYQKLINENYDWYDVVKGYFYHIQRKNLIQYNTLNKIASTNLNMALKTKYIRTLPDTDKTSSIDHFIYDHIGKLNPKIKVYHDTNDYISLDTHGMNNISKKRDRFFQNISWPFVKTNETLHTLNIPLNVKEKLSNLVI